MLTGSETGGVLFGGLFDLVSKHTGDKLLRRYGTSIMY